MVESEMSISSKDSKSLRESRVSENQFTDISAQEIINNEFDSLEEWYEKQLGNIKKKCLDNYNNFHVVFPNEKNKVKEKEKDKESNSYEEEKSNE